MIGTPWKQNTCLLICVAAAISNILSEIFLNPNGAVEITDVIAEHAKKHCHQMSNMVLLRKGIIFTMAKIVFVNMPKAVPLQRGTILTMLKIIFKINKKEGEKKNRIFKHF